MPGNFNDQSVPGRVGANSSSVLDLCLQQDFIGIDSEPIRPRQRVYQVSRGYGTVESLGTLIERKAFVIFDSGTRMFVPCSDLYHA